jgi:hypothetical protein
MSGQQDQDALRTETGLYLLAEGRPTLVLHYSLAAELKRKAQPIVQPRPRAVGCQKMACNTERCTFICPFACGRLARPVPLP